MSLTVPIWCPNNLSLFPNNLYRYSLLTFFFSSSVSLCQLKTNKKWNMHGSDTGISKLVPHHFRNHSYFCNSLFSVLTMSNTRYNSMWVYNMQPVRLIWPESILINARLHPTGQKHVHLQREQLLRELTRYWAQHMTGENKMKLNLLK